MTQSEIAAILAASDAGKELLKPENKELLDYMLGAITQQQAALEADLYNTLIGQLQQPVSAAATAKARDQAQKQAKRITGNLVEAQLNAIGETIASGLEAGKGPREVAKTLEVITSLDAPRAAKYLKYVDYLESQDLTDEEVAKQAEAYYQQLLKERRETIARTEMRDATAEARDIEARQAGKKFKAWLTVGDDRVSDVCQANEAQGWISIDDSFTGGDTRPPQHPNCRCTLAYRKAPPGPDEKKHAKDRADTTKAAKNPENQ